MHLPTANNASDTTEKRSTRRRPVYKSEGMLCRIRWSAHKASGHIADITPQGLGVLLAPGKTLPRPGDIVDVDYRSQLGSKLFRASGTVIHVTLDKKKRGAVYVGISLIASSKPAAIPSINKRRDKRFVCDEFFRPMAWADSHVFFMEKLFFQVQELSPGGLTLIASTRHKEILANAEFTLNVALPILGNFVVQAVVCNVARIKGSDRLRVGVKLEGDATAFLEACGQFLLISSPGTSLSLLREAGFPCRSIESAAQLTYPSNRQDFLEILQLRLLVYRAAGRTQSDDPGSMLDRFDAYSRHLMLRVGDRLAGAMRIVFPDGCREHSELESEDGFRIPEGIWQERFGEVSLAVIHPDYVRSDGYLYLLRHAFRVGHALGYRYSMVASSDNFLQKYLTLGYEQTGQTRELSSHSEMVRFHLLVADIPEAMRKGSLGERVSGFFGPLGVFVAQPFDGGGAPSP